MKKGRTVTVTRLNSATTGLCPAWCNEHLGELGEGLHQRHLGDLHGQLQVVLEQDAHDNGRPNLSVRFCTDGELADDAVDLPLDAILAVLAEQPIRRRDRR